MTVEAAFRDLTLRLRRIEDALDGLRLTVIEDHPLDRDVSFVDALSNVTLDLLGQTKEAIEAACEGERAVGHPPDLDRARRALARCHERFNLVAQQFTTRLASYETLTDLTDLGRQRPGEWRAWSASAKEMVDRLQQPLHDVEFALLACWQELVERATQMVVSVQAVGQQIQVPDRQWAREGLT